MLRAATRVNVKVKGYYYRNFKTELMSQPEQSLITNQEGQPELI
jgi:hypothetical protein